MGAFLGMRGTGDWLEGQDPQNWREMILYEFPNGDAPLTAILSMMDSEQISNTVHNWWIEIDPAMGGAIAGVFLDPAMTQLYINPSSGTKGKTIYLKVAESNAVEVNKGAELRMVQTEMPSNSTIGKATSILLNGDNSRISVILKEADKGTAANHLGVTDYMQISGHIQPQGAAMPDAVHYNPTLYTNFMQILEEPFKITRTARKSKLRTGDQYQQDKLKTLQRVSKKMELAMLNGIRSEVIGDNGEPELTMQGIIPMIQQLVPDHYVDFRYDSDFAGESWINSGEAFMDKMLEIASRWGSSERLALVGSGAMAAITSLAKANGQINLTPNADGTYGLKVVTWIGMITLHLKTHPLFSRVPADRFKMLILDPKNIKYMYIDDLFFKEDPNKDKGGNNSFDGTLESYLAECTLEYRFPLEFMLLDGLGQTNVMTP